MKTIALMFLVLTMLTGCNTLNGMGKDVERLGEKVQNATKK
jgi:entericidin A